MPKTPDKPTAAGEQGNPAQSSGNTASAKPVRGRPFLPGQSGNPGGQPKGIQRKARELVGQDGRKLLEFWLKVMQDEGEQIRWRLEAARLIADRAFGRPVQQLTGADGGPLEVARVEVVKARERVAGAVDELAARRSVRAEEIDQQQQQADG